MVLSSFANQLRYTNNMKTLNETIREAIVVPLITKDIQMIRSSIKEEYDAATTYENNALDATDERVIALYHELANDERTHAEELQELLMELQNTEIY